MTLQWDNLEEPWQCCLEEAWTAYCMGSIPIGSAITDQHGRIAARGRNRIFEETALGKLLCGHRLAHAEMNALIALEWHQADVCGYALYTTTEPCALCTGAIRTTKIGTVRYAARDSAGGSISLLEATPYMRNGGIRAVGPQDLELETIIVALHVEFSLRTDHFSRSPWVLETWRTTVPRGVALGQELFRSGQLQQWHAERTSIAQVIRGLTVVLTADGGHNEIE